MILNLTQDWAYQTLVAGLAALLGLAVIGAIRAAVIGLTVAWKAVRP